MSIEQLQNLSEQDARIYELNALIEKVRKTMQERVAEVQQAQARLDSCEKRERELELHARAVESEVQAAEDELRKFESQRMQASSQKILEGVDAKIVSQKSIISVLEERWMDLQEGLEGARENSNQTRESLRRSRNDQEVAISKGNRELDELESECRELLDLRPSALDGLETEILQAYEKQRARDAFAKVLFDIQENNCPRCGMQIPNRTFEVVRYRGEVTSCSSCSSLLFYSGS